MVLDVRGFVKKDDELLRIICQACKAVDDDVMYLDYAYDKCKTCGSEELIIETMFEETECTNCGKTFVAWDEAYEDKSGEQRICVDCYQKNLVERG